MKALVNEAVYGLNTANNTSITGQLAQMIANIKPAVLIASVKMLASLGATFNLIRPMADRYE